LLEEEGDIGCILIAIDFLGKIIQYLPFKQEKIWEKWMILKNF